MIDTSKANFNSIYNTLKNAPDFRNQMYNTMIELMDNQEKLFAKQESNLPPDLAEKLIRIRQRSSEHPVFQLFRDNPLAKALTERYNNKQQLRLMKYMTRVQDKAAQKMLEDKEFAKPFAELEEFDAVILSVDIRRSTELMLRAKSPQFYAEFVNELNTMLIDVVKENFGIYDKFTGDGLLAFFPDFYSGKDALIYALECADECKAVFNSIFTKYEDNFNIDRKITGLGAGIDCGSVYKAGVETEYTVVGSPVVYACRLSCAPAGSTYITVRAQNKLSSMNCTYFNSQPTKVAIKHEATAYAFSITRKPNARLHLNEPEWYNSTTTK
ncbi:MAG: adenylate/guanylate cyclase domain-containing protein [Treponema sp.]|nr:adenylate/guanylate cyclase domain-containing protein [Treponema sp.]HAM78176.1 hypothetical protein [Treponema sp.]HBB13359.1 hypothetical protein [Treponema sp.]